MAESKKSGLSAGAWMFLLAWPVLVAGALLKWTGVLGVAGDIAQRPRVAVLDVRAAIDARMKAEGRDNQGLAEATAHVQGIARRLRSAGYMVLDSSYVYAFPAEFEVDAGNAAPADTLPAGAAAPGKAERR